MTARKYHSPEKPTPGNRHNGKPKFFRVDDSIEDALIVTSKELGFTQNTLANAAFGELLLRSPEEINAVVANYSATRETVRDTYQDAIAKLSGKKE